MKKKDPVTIDCCDKFHYGKRNERLITFGECKYCPFCGKRL